jgi:hypothetical protein
MGIVRHEAWPHPPSVLKHAASSALTAWPVPAIKLTSAGTSSGLHDGCTMYTMSQIMCAATQPSLVRYVCSDTALTWHDA